MCANESMANGRTRWLRAGGAGALAWAALAAATWTGALQARPAAAQAFTEVGTPLPAPPTPCVAWGDVDGDGDLDVLVAGNGKHDVAFTTLYTNSGGALTASPVVLLGLSRAAAAWGDLDGDGDLDLAMTGLTSAGASATRVYRNDGSVFAAAPGSFLGEFAGCVAWADADGDGDLDLVVTGVTSATGPSVTRLYRNDGGSFTSVAHPFPNVGVSTLAWADADGDGRPDLAICGASSVGGLISSVFHNDGGGAFTDIGAGLPGNDLGPMAWGDYDGDGDADLLLGGNSDDGFIMRVYRNDAGAFTDVGAGLQPLLWASAAWGDFDGDGDLDLAVSGYDAGATVPRTILYRNDAGTFVDSGNAFHNVYLGGMGWVDYDSDGDLDLWLAGNEGGTDIVNLNRNNTPVANAPPSAPGGLAVTAAGSEVVLAWGAGADDHTPAAGLTYSVRVGTTPGGSEVVSAHATAAGVRLLPDMGNAVGGRTLRLQGLVAGTTYYWSVQAVDASLTGSPFAAEASFVAGVAGAPAGGPAARAALARPNPFVGATALRFVLPAPSGVRVDLFDAAGRRVRAMWSGTLARGSQELRWDGSDDAGRRLPAGTYLYRVTGGNVSTVGTVVKLD